MRKGHLGRLTSMLIVMMVGGQACAASDSKKLEATQAEQTAFGSYLAGQHARIRGDNEAAVNYFLDVIKADPDNLVLVQQGFALAISDGRYDDARRLAEKLAKADAQNSLAQFFLMLGDIKAKRYGKVHTALTDVTDAGLNRLLKPLVDAWAFAGQKKKAEALAALSPLDEAPPFRIFALHHKAFILDYLNDADAEAAYKAVVDGESLGSLRVVLGYAGLLAREQRLDEARALIEASRSRYEDVISMDLAERRLGASTLEKTIIKEPADGVAEAFYGSAAALSQDGANAPAACYLRLALYLEPQFAQAKYLLARILEYEEQYEAALNAYAAIPNDSEFSADARLREVWVLEGMGKQDDSLARLQALAASSPENFTVASALADLYRQRERYEDAIAEYTRAIAIAPEKAELWVLYYARGIAYDFAKQWPAAETDLKKALELEPEQADVLNYLGYSWIDRGQHLEKALDMIVKAVAERPNDGYIVDSLGWAEFKLGRYDAAVEHLEKAVLLKPEDPTINEHLGDAYWKVGREAEARFQWSHALTLDAPEDRIALIREKIEKGFLEKASQAVQNDDQAKPRP